MSTREAIESFLKSHFPQAPIVVESVEPKKATVRIMISERNLRPGGTVSGPTLMALADTALYVAILGTIGIVPLAVTTNLNINFLRKPKADKDVLGHCVLHKVGKTLAVGEVSMFSEGDDEPVAHATGTYAIPPNREQQISP